jgi:hypothetical protein
MAPSIGPIDHPDTRICSAAVEFVFEVSSPLVANHCVRSYLFGRELAAAKGLRRDVDYDDELVFLSCTLHDLGVTEHANGDQRFEVDGADAAAQFLRDHGMSEDRIETVWQAVALHTSAGLAHRFGTEQAVTQLGISADIMGVDKHLLPTGYAEKAHESWPRYDLGYTLAEIIAQQVHDNPLKGPPLSFPAHLHELYYPTAAFTWFDAVAVAGWNDQRRITDGSTQ